MGQGERQSSIDSYPMKAYKHAEKKGEFSSNDELSMGDQNIYFMVSCARSGSTSLAKIFGEASNGCCLSEPAPSLNVECRQQLDRKLPDPKSVIAQAILPRVRDNLCRHDVYGEKNVTLTVFIPHLHDLFKCKFIYLRRDGRDVVRSLMNWHNKKFGSVYRECRDAGRLNPEARHRAGKLPVHMDTSDYSRPRPQPDSELYAEWDSLSRQEMCAYYWSTINEIALQHVEALPPGTSTTLDYTAPRPEDVLEASKFCGLKGLSLGRIQELLQSNINSLKDRGTDDSDLHADWKNWDGGERRRFERIAGASMKRLGYFRGTGTDWKPASYGAYWHGNSAGYDWYLWMHEYRKPIHSDFFAWAADRDCAGDTIESIADFGCGLGIGYCEQFADKRYIGIDLASKNTDWCLKHRSNPKHAYYSFDFMETPLTPRADVVTSSGTIDNCYDIEVFLDSMLRSARKWIYLTCYRGWFPELEEHKYRWEPDHGCFYNDISPGRVRAFLKARGCTCITIDRLRTGRFEIPYETRIVARVP